MGKFDIDDILNDLGVSGEGKGKRQRKQLPSGGADEGGPARRLDPEHGSGTHAPNPHEPPLVLRRDDGEKKHTIDKAEAAFSPLPAVPSGQGGQQHVSDDPAVPVKPAATPQAGVGDALKSIYEPDAPGADGTGAIETTGGSSDLAQTLLNRGIITGAVASSSQQVVKGSPGRKLTDVLVEQGADEIKVYESVAELADVPFERVDLNLGLDGGFDGVMLQRLTAEFCKAHMVLPLRVLKTASGGAGRVVIGSSAPDDVFLLDEVRRRLGISSIKLVVVPPSDIKMALEVVSQAATAEQEQENISDILSEVDEGDVQVEKVKESQEVDLESQAAESPVIRYVNYIIQTAVKEGRERHSRGAVREEAEGAVPHRRRAL